MAVQVTAVQVVNVSNHVKLVMELVYANPVIAEEW